MPPSPGIDGADLCGAIPVLRTGLRVLGLRADRRELELFTTYCRLLLTANQHINLTAIRHPDDIARSHFLDALTIAVALPDAYLATPQHVIDVGSGGGVPGIPLAIVFDRWRVTLLESVGKKARFLETAVEALNLTNVDVASERAEAAGRGRRRERYDLAVARAVARLDVLIEYCAPLVRVGGTIVLYKSGTLTDELREACAALQALGCTLQACVPVPTAVGLRSMKQLVVVTKTEPTPARFPRREGVARSHPLR